MFKIEDYPKDIGKIIEDIEYKEDKLEVIYYKEWLLPFHKYKVKINSIVYRSISIIEEFILNIGLTDLGNNNTIDDIALMLGLDKIFIETYVDKMARNGMLYLNKLPHIITTESGKNLYKSKLSLDFEKQDVLEAYYHPYINNIYDYKKKDYENKSIDILHLNNDFEDKICNINEDLKNNISELAKCHKIICEKKVINQEVKDIEMEKLDGEIAYFRIVELWIYDIVEKVLQCRVWNFENNSFDNEISKLICNIKPLKKEDFNLSDEIKKESVIKQSNSLEEKFIQEKKENKHEKSKLRIIRGKEIKEEFNKTFNMVKQRMYIQSPWISEKVVDDDMIKKIKKLAAKNCKIFITWGISRNINNEDRKAPEMLLEKLKSIKSPDNLPAVFVIWIGNHHNKEIIVDDKIHIAGSFNWLFYRGDYLPRGESVYLTNDKECIKEAKYYLEDQIVNSLGRDMLKGNFYSNLNCLLNLEYHEEKVREILDCVADQLINDERLVYLRDLLMRNGSFLDICEKIDKNGITF
ncbi:MAG: hypothetical protein SOX50_04775 [Terrisporobacter othiniensis]|uniref:hypothetical protein n=1 Tax=Terrisporobacter othiniensis TaxID=1577792 RepID=UPI000941CEB4|nr:hypothetical protein [Terrisporobacter othiniensis]MDY3372570.1 hypothetical protein [Terrisporobacter othiniensis]